MAILKTNEFNKSNIGRFLSYNLRYMEGNYSSKQGRIRISIKNLLKLNQHPSAGTSKVTSFVRSISAVPPCLTKMDLCHRRVQSYRDVLIIASKRRIRR